MGSCGCGMVDRCHSEIVCRFFPVDIRKEHILLPSHVLAGKGVGAFLDDIITGSNGEA